MDEFVIWESEYNEGECVVGNPSGFEDQFLLLEGVPLLSQWPDNVICKMSPRYPKDIQLTDNLYGGNYAVISKRLKEETLALAGASNVEFLPISVLNHKGRVASKDYYVMNPVGTLDCVDIEKSGVVWNALNKNLISQVKHLVLKNDGIPPEVAVFRLTYMAPTILVRRSLADHLSSRGFTGLCFRKLADFTG